MKTEIIFVTDRSGSMATIWNECIGGLKSFIEDQKKVAGECRVTQVIFDHVIETQYEGKPLAEVQAQLPEPRGTTALYDAIGMTLTTQGERIAREKWADLVVFNIITDGGENASKEYSAARVKEMIAHAEKNGWKFIYMATGLDAFNSLRTAGVAGQSIKSFSKTSIGTQSAYYSASVDTVQLRSGLAPKNEPTQ